MAVWVYVAVALFLALILALRPAVRAIKLLFNVVRFPGPPAAPFIGHFLDFLRPGEGKTFLDVLSRFSQQYPFVFRVWFSVQPAIITVSPEAVEVILSSSDPAHLPKSFAYEYLQDWLGKGLLTSTGSKWHLHRKILTPAFHFKILHDFMGTMVRNSDILVEKLRTKAGSEAFNISPFLSHCALDIICESAMGTSVSAQTDGESEYVSAVYEMSNIVQDRIFQPWLFFSWIFYRSSLGKRQGKCLEILHGFSKQVIKERRRNMKIVAEQKQEASDNDVSGGKKRLAFLDLLLDASEDGALLSEEEIREEVDTFMFEGHDTTTSAINWCLLMLGCHHEIQEKVAEELCNIFEGSDRQTKFADLSKMKYLEQCIKETLRLYPSVPTIARKIRGDIAFGPYTVSDGGIIAIPIFCVHRNSDIFPNPEEFNPDHFLPERVQGRHPYSYIPFSAGPRNCIGQKFAMMELKTVISSVLRYFRVESEQEKNHVQLNPELVLRPKGGILVKLSARKWDRLHLSGTDE